MSEELNIDEQIALVDASIEAQEKTVAKAEALDRLLNGTPKKGDFSLVMIEGYLEVEANRVFNLLTSPRVTKPEEVESYMSQLDTIKNVYRYLGDEDYLGTVNILALNAQKQLDDDMQLKQELLAKKGA